MLNTCRSISRAFAFIRVRSRRIFFDRFDFEYLYEFHSEHKVRHPSTILQKTCVFWRLRECAHSICEQLYPFVWSYPPSRVRVKPENVINGKGYRYLVSIELFALSRDRWSPPIITIIIVLVAFYPLDCFVLERPTKESCKMKVTDIWSETSGSMTNIVFFLFDLSNCHRFVNTTNRFGYTLKTDCS